MSKKPHKNQPNSPAQKRVRKYAWAIFRIDGMLANLDLMHNSLLCIDASDASRELRKLRKDLDVELHREAPEYV